MAALDTGETRMHIEYADAIKPRARRELAVFLRRWMRRLGERSAWSVSVTGAASAAFRCAISIRRGSVTLRQHGDGEDPVLAAWNAISRIEQVLHTWTR
jgi:hypothetical protein